MANIQEATEAALAVIQREEGLVTQEEVVKALDLRNRLREFVRELDGQVEAATIRWIDANGEIEVGDIRYYVGAEKKVRCVDTTRTAEAILERVGGSVGDFVATLVSQPFKPGAAQSVLGDESDRLFSVTHVQDLKEGKPRKRLKVANERFGPRPVPDKD